jgi:hypothetical protein
VIEAFFRLNSAAFATNLKINSSSNYMRVEEESVYVVRLSGEEFGGQKQNEGCGLQN